MKRLFLTCDPMPNAAIWAAVLQCCTRHDTKCVMIDERSDVPTVTTVRMLADHAPQITPEAMEAYCSTLERAEPQKGRNGHWRERNAPFYMGVPKRARNKRR